MENCKRRRSMYLDSFYSDFNNGCGLCVDRPATGSVVSYPGNQKEMGLAGDQEAIQIPLGVRKMKDSVYIVAGGTSLSKYNFSKLKDKEVITVNHSLYSVPWCKYFVTMDYSFLTKTNIDRFRSIDCDKYFVVNLAVDYLKEINGAYIDTRSEIGYDLKDFDVIVKSYQKEGLGLDFKNFCNGFNSAFCAFQLAVILGYKEINLLGFDFRCDKQTHYHNAYKQDAEHFQRKLDEYYRTFLIGLETLYRIKPEVKVNNCSKTSRLIEHLGLTEE